MHSDSPIAVAEVDRILAAHCEPMPAERVPLVAAAGRVLRQDVLAERPSPPFHRAAMDGICIARAALEAGQRRFAIAGMQRAGDPEAPLPSPDVCMEIMTGAVLCVGADAVIQVEHITVADGHAVLPNDYSVKDMQNVHQRGSDHDVSTVLLRAGRVLEAPQIAILASCGVADVAVAAAPTVAVVATGNELVEVDASVAPHQIRMSNVYAVDAALRRDGVQTVDRYHLQDDLATMRRELGAALDSHDVVVLSGGISMGKTDHVIQVLGELGVEIHVTRVQQRPGKPFVFGTRADGRRVFALPGNPVSTVACLRRYVLPYLRAAAGRRAVPPLHARLASDFSFKPALTLYLPVSVSCDDATGSFVATPMPTNGSGDWAGLGETDGILQLPADTTDFPAGTLAPFFPW